MPAPTATAAESQRPARTPAVGAEDAAAGRGRHVAPAPIGDAEQWLQLVAATPLRGPARELAANAAFSGYADAVLRLSLSPAFDYLRTDSSVDALAQALSEKLGRVPKIVFDAGAAAGGETLKARDERERDQRRSQAEQRFRSHPEVQWLVQQHGARIVPDSIRPYDE
ncbi:MAG: DNA polymerase III subunit gamma/tau C-terminal domain-containing protein [Pseudoxanthomonas sp.]